MITGIITEQSSRITYALEAMSADEVQKQIAALQREGKLPMQMTKETMDEMSKSMARYFSDVSQAKIQEFADKAKELAQKALANVEVKVPGVEGTVERSVEYQPDRMLLADFIEAHGIEKVGETMNMELFFRIPREVAYGAGNFVRQNAAPEDLDAYPALELLRAFDRLVPRGSTDKPMDDDWPTRWEAAGGELVDGERMVALKSDPVWQALGDGEGGYDDALGNPFPPFAFNSGYEVNEITTDEAIELGLMNEGDEVQPAQFDFLKLFAPLESRRAA